MKQLFFILLLIGNFAFSMHAQQTATIITDEKIMMLDSTKSCCASCYCNLISVGGKYYFNTLGNTRTILANNGFIMDQEAFEYQVRLYNLPKIFYFQQLGSLTNNNYASVTGFGVKEDIRWNVFKNSNFILTPYVELGGGYYKLNIAKGVTSSSISSVLTSTVENYSIDNFVFSGDIGIDLGIGFNVDDKRFSIIANGGYITNYPAEWRLAGSLAFKEKVNLGSPYAGVTLRLEMDCASCGNKTCK